MNHTYMSSSGQRETYMTFGNKKLIEKANCVKLILGQNHYLGIEIQALNLPMPQISRPSGEMSIWAKAIWKFSS